MVSLNETPELKDRTGLIAKKKTKTIFADSKQEEVVGGWTGTAG